MDNGLKRKHNLMMTIEKYERALIELSRWKPGDFISISTSDITGDIPDEKSKTKWMNTLKEFCDLNEKEKSSNNGKLYLSEIVSQDKPTFCSNNLILAPTGSGKTHLMRDLIKHEEILFLVSTTSLKDKFVPKSEDDRKELGNRMFSTKRTRVYGEGTHKIYVMTYAEFGELVKYTNHFADNYSQIFCDEIHSLLHYHKIGSSDTLLSAMRCLFAVKEGQEKYYFTATDEHIKKLQKINDKILENVKFFNYLDHPEIVKHMVLSSYKISNLEQIRPHLKARKESFKYFSYKVFAFSRTISSQKVLEKIMIEEGFNPLVLWSINSTEHEMDEEQLKQRDYVLRTGLIPDEYDALIVNASMQEGWDLLDPKVKLVIMNTTNKTEFIQSVGRVRGDVDVLVYKVSDDEVNYYVDFPTKYINTPLTTSVKKELCEQFNLRNQNGRLLLWPSLAKILKSQGLFIEDKNILINGKPTRVSVVNLIEHVWLT